MILRPSIIISLTFVLWSLVNTGVIVVHGIVHQSRGMLIFSHHCLLSVQTMHTKLIKQWNHKKLTKLGHEYIFISPVIIMIFSYFILRALETLILPRVGRHTGIWRFYDSVKKTKIQFPTFLFSAHQKTTHKHTNEFGKGGILTHFLCSLTQFSNISNALRVSV